MSLNYCLEKSKVCLLIVDVQEKLFPVMERTCEVMHAMQKTVKGFSIMKLPIIVSEQYPQGLGHTVPSLKNILDNSLVITKTTFSCIADPLFADTLKPYDQVVIIGVEAHICVLQTAKDLLRNGIQVVVLNDAITSRSIYDFSTAIAELRDAGARISSVETILFELLGSSKASEFKQINELITS